MGEQRKGWTEKQVQRGRKERDNEKEEERRQAGGVGKAREDERRE